jgi:hypothetical protein
MLGDYKRLSYNPALERADMFAGKGRGELKRVVAEAKDLSARWQTLQIRSVHTDIEKQRTLFAGDGIGIQCDVFLDGVDPNELQVQVRYRTRDDGEIDVIPLKATNGAKDGVHTYAGKVQLHSSGLQELDVVLVPAEEMIRELYPDLVIWAT